MNTFPYTNPYSHPPQQQQQQQNRNSSSYQSIHDDSRRNSNNSNNNRSQFSVPSLDDAVYELVQKQTRTTASRLDRSTLRQYAQLFAVTATSTSSSSKSSTSNNNRSASDAWTVPTAKALAGWVVRLAQEDFESDNVGGVNSPNNSNSISSRLSDALGLLAVAMEHWSDGILYHVAVCEISFDGMSATANVPTLLSVLENLVASRVNDDTANDSFTSRGQMNHHSNSAAVRGGGRRGVADCLQQTAMVCLVTAWRVLQDMDRCTRLAPKWQEQQTTSDNTTALWWMSTKTVLMTRNSPGLDASTDSNTRDANTYWKLAVDRAMRDLAQTNDDDADNQEMSTEADAALTLVSPQDVQRASALFLTIVAQHGVTDWLHELQHHASRSTTTTNNMDTGAETSSSLLTLLTEHLCRHAARLNDPNMPCSSFSKLSLAALSLLAVCEYHNAIVSYPSGSSSNYSTLLGSTDLVQHVVTAALGDGDDDNNNSNTSMAAAPRWTQSASTVQSSYSSSNSSMSSTGSAMAVWRVWNQCGGGGDAWSIVQKMIHPSRLRSYAAKCWTSLVSSSSNSTNDHALSPERARTLLFLYTTFRCATREALASVLFQKADSVDENSRRLVAALLQGPSSSLALLRTILEDRQCLTTHDELSRSICKAVDQSFIENCLQKVATLESSPINRASLLIVLDIVQSTLTSDPELCRYLLQQGLQTESMECLIQIMAPKETVPFDQNSRTMDTSFLPILEDETPPANNLSRLDETSMSICVMEPAHEQGQQPRGLDSFVRVSVATALAVLGTCPVESSQGRVALLQGRMREAVNSFAGDFLSQGGSISGGERIHNSSDMTRRRLRLLTTLATRDNEEYLTGLLHTAESSQQESVRALQSTVARGKQILNEYVEREKRLLAEKEVYARKLTSQAVTFQREKNQFQQGVAQNAKQLVEVHSAERCKAEQRLQEMARHVSEAEARATEADRVARTCRETEAETKAAFERATAKLEELELKEQGAAQRTQDRETELVRLREELRSSKESHSELVHRENEMRSHIQKQEESLANTEESHGAMREGLESLFGDMVSLSQLYEVKEREAASTREDGGAAVQKVKRKLEAEQKRTFELEEKYRQIQYDNDMLSKKYARAREKLEEERKQRQKDAERRNKRTGPVSYINQLHTSTVDRSSAADRSRGGKENDSQSASTASSSAKRSYR